MIEISDDCINCKACVFVCSTEAIYKPGENWKENKKFFAPRSTEHYFIVSSKCNKCYGFKEIKCMSICPMDAIKIS